MARTTQPPGGVGPNAADTGGVFLWTGSDPTKNQIGGATATLRGTNASGADGTYQHFNTSAGAMSWAVSTPASAYTLALGICFPTTDGNQRTLFSVPGKFRIDVKHSGGGVYITHVHTGIVAAPAWIVGESGADTEMWSYVARYTGTQLVQYLLDSTGAVQATRTTTMSFGGAGTSVELGTSVPADAAYTAYLVNGDLGDTRAIALRDNIWSSYADSGASVVVSSASIPVTASTFAGTQSHSGLVASASIGVQGGAVVGSQTYIGAVSDGTIVVSAGTVSGSSASAGVVSPASITVTASSPAGSQSHIGSVAGASVGIAAAAPAGSQQYIGAVSSASVPVSASTVSGGGASYSGVVSPASVAVTASTPAGVQTYAGSVSASAVTVTAGAASGTQAHVGAVASASIVVTASTILAPGEIKWPDPADVRAGVFYGPTGVEYEGAMVAGFTSGSFLNVSTGRRVMVSNGVAVSL